jgi:hypothetical protein
MGVQYKGEHPQVAGVSLEIIAAVIGFIVVVVMGKWLGSRKPQAAGEQPADGGARN